MPFDAKQYAEQLLQEAGASEEQKQAFMALVGNEKFSKRLGTDVMMQSDYNRNMDLLRTENQKTNDYYATLVKWEAQRKADWDAEFARVNGNGNGNGNGNINVPDIDKRFKDLEDKYMAAAKQQEAAFITVAKKMGKLASQHAVEFKEALDTDALEKIAIERKLDLDHAYDALVADRRRTLTDTALTERIKREREEAVREFASTRHIPVDSAPRDSGYGRLQLVPEKDSQIQAVPHEGRLTPTGFQNLRANFVDEWNKAGGSQ